MERSLMAAPELFLLTPLREGRRAEMGGAETMVKNFYSRPCGRGDDFKDIWLVGDYSISTHAPAGGATFWQVAANKPLRAFLLTPLREGRLEQIYKGVAKDIISTHAPAGGATAWIRRDNH